MRNVDHTDTLGFEVSHYLEQLLNFSLCESGSRLVKDEELTVTGNCFSYFNHLLFTNGELAKSGSWVNLDTDELKELFSLLYHLVVVDKDFTSHRLSAYENVLSNSQVIHHVQFLMYHTDAEILRFSNILYRIRSTIICDGSFVRLMDTCKYLHQGGFSRTVFTNKCVYFAEFKIEMNTLKSMYTMESLMYSVHFEQKILRHKNTPFRFLHSIINV